MMISRERANILRAIAIIAVLIGHGFSRLTECQSIILNFMGGVGVSIFLLLSGYGLCESYKENQNLSRFWKKRIETVMIPYWIAMCIQAIVDYIVLGRAIILKSYIMSFLGFNNYSSFEGIDSTMWYITFLFFCYLIFWGVFILHINDNMKAIALGALFIIFFKNSVILNTDWYINYFSFPIGVYMSLFGNRMTKKMIIVVHGVSLLGFFYTISCFLNGKLTFENMLLLYCICGGLFFISLPLDDEKNDGIIKIIGGASYAIYLVEGAILERYTKFYVVESGIEDMIIFWIVSVELGVFAHFLYLKVIKPAINKALSKSK